jgi:hypothetical protein
MPCGQKAEMLRSGGVGRGVAGEMKIAGIAAIPRRQRVPSTPIILADVPHDKHREARKSA